MKKLLFLFLIIPSVIFSQHPDGKANDTIYPAKRVPVKENLMKAAHDYSESGKGIGIYMLSGKEYKNLSDEQINTMFNNSVRSHDVEVKVFVNRETQRNTSLYKCYVLGEGIGVKSNIEAFSRDLTKAIRKFKSSKDILYNRNKQN